MKGRGMAAFLVGRPDRFKVGEGGGGVGAWRGKGASAGGEGWSEGLRPVIQI